MEEKKQSDKHIDIVGTEIERKAKEEEREKEHTDNEIKYFESSCCPMGWRDIQMAINLAKQYGKEDPSGWLKENLDNYIDSTEAKLEDCDIGYIAYDAILQEVRNEIIEIIEFDICNDANFYTHGNYMCSSIDHSEQDTEKLTEVIQHSDASKQREILENEVIKEFLDEIGIEINAWMV